MPDNLDNLDTADISALEMNHDLTFVSDDTDDDDDDACSKMPLLVAGAAVGVSGVLAGRRLKAWVIAKRGDLLARRESDETVVIELPTE